MVRQRPLLLFILICVLVSLACNAFAGNPEPALELPPPTVVTTLAPGETPVDDAAPTVTLPGEEVAEATAVPQIEGPYVTVLVDLNVRTGPGVQYDRVGFLLEGESVAVIGIDPNTGWWKIICPLTIEAAGECWLSGGSQYSQGTNTSNVPVAIAPPTPTPPPTHTPTPAPDAGESGNDTTPSGGFIAYADNTGLWVVPLDTSQSPPTAGTPIQLSDAADISQPLISPDGRKVAFLRGDSSSNVLGFLNTDAEGGDMLTASVSIPNSGNSSDTAVLIDQIAWLPDSQSLAFSTKLINQVGPGVQPQADLWTVTLSRNLTERFPAGSGGHTFAISPNGSQVIFGLPESIVQANMNGSNAQTALTFSFVNTASEYAYAPRVQWLANGLTAVTAVSDADPWQAGTEAALYQIQNGSSLVQGNIPGNILFSPVYWTNNGNQLAYVQFLPDGSGTQTLVIADGRGNSPQAYRTDDNLRLFGWNPGSSYILYAGDGYFGVGQQGAAPNEVLIPVGLQDAQWLTGSSFVMSLGSGSSWNLTSANLNGDTEILATASGNQVQFDTWTP